MWEAVVDRFLPNAVAGKALHLLYLGDHDPSGLAMREDIQSRLDLFLSEHCASQVNVHSIVLTMEQVREYNLPPNPAKETDRRFTGYQKEYCNQSWELDALSSTVLTDLIETNILALLDEEAWQDAVEQQEEQRLVLASVAKGMA
jgi:primosomal protein N''